MQQIRCFLRKFLKGYVAVFLLLLSVLSFVSLGDLIMAYKTGETINNQITGDDRLESDLSANIFAKDIFLNLNGGMRLLFGQREMNGVVRLENGYLSELNAAIEESGMERNVRHLAEFKKDIQSHGIPFLYVLTPYKIQQENSQLPQYMVDHTNESLDIFIEKVNDAGVSPLDLREVFSQGDEDPYSLFYRTDHHWNIEGGFIAYTAIAQQIADMLDVDLGSALLSRDQFYKKVYEGAHLGYYGQRTGSVFAGGADDFALWLPNFDTEIVNTNTGEKGTFEELLINDEYLEEKRVSSRYTYDNVFMAGNFQSLRSGCGKKILFVSDSMGKAVLPFLVLTFGEICYVDANDPTDLTAELLQEYQPDIVVIMHYPLSAFTRERFDFLPV